MVAQEVAGGRDRKVYRFLMCTAFRMGIFDGARNLFGTFTEVGQANLFQFAIVDCRIDKVFILLRLLRLVDVDQGIFHLGDIPFSHAAKPDGLMTIGIAAMVFSRYDIRRFRYLAGIKRDVVDAYQLFVGSRFFFYPADYEAHFRHGTGECHRGNLTDRPDAERGEMACYRLVPKHGRHGQTVGRHTLCKLFRSEVVATDLSSIQLGTSGTFVKA